MNGDRQCVEHFFNCKGKSKKSPENLTSLLSVPYLPYSERFKQWRHLGTLGERFETC